jgi:CheY-like chemotaxis protein
MLVRVLERAGYATVSAENGEQALDQCLKHDPALIFMDMMMPGMDGPEVARRLGELLPGGVPPLVVVTAGLLTEETNTEIEAVAIVKKPFSVERILKLAREHAGKPEE